VLAWSVSSEIDELHDYKNLFTPSNIRDAAITGADRASDLHLKVDYLRQRHGGRALIGATATPIANSITEAYVMQRYLRPDLLTEAGIGDFDTWAATFGSTVSALEMSPDGGSWRMKTRFAKFRNTPELLRMWHVGADVKTAEELNLPVPQLTARDDGQRAPQTIVVAPSDQVRAYVAELGKRAEAVRNGQVEPKDDNMLSITSDERAAALDLRLIRAREDGEVMRSTRPHPARAPPPRSVSPGSGRTTRTGPTSPPPGPCTHVRGRCNWCSPTWAPPGSTGTSTTTSSRS